LYRHYKEAIMNGLRRLLVAVLACCTTAAAVAQSQSPVIIVNLLELSGAGAIAGTNFNNGVLLAFNEINAAGGILSQRVQVVSFDTQSDPELAKTLAQRVVALRPYVIMGPVFSSTTLAAMDEMRRAEIPTFTGGEASEITLRGNPYVFRTSFTQATAMPRLAKYVRDSVRARSIAVVWVNNDFGRGGRAEMTKALGTHGIKVVADIPIEPLQTNCAAAVTKVRQADADAVFVYLNEQESPHCLLELKKQAYDGWVVGETTAMGQGVIEVAGEAANGVHGHVGLTPHALIPAVRAFDNKFVKEYRYRSDHNGMKGYIAGYVVKAVTEKVGKFDSKALAAAMKGVALSAKEYPGVLLDVKYDEKGDVDRASFIVRVSGGRHEFIATLPATAGEIVRAPTAR
jgi:branched-chain amino acid transport system substrate-binding protein